ncbi:MAG TPA: ABC transporter permease [Firmicutes bacterium]|nr:ABC transporter permease [Bacillota bacterium]
MSGGGKNNGPRGIRRGMKRISRALGLAIAVAGSFVTGALLLLVAGVNPIPAYVSFLDGAFGSLNGLTQTLLVAIPLATLGAGVSFAAQCQVFNIGGEGQLLLGAVGCTLVGLHLGGLPAVLVLPAMLLMGAVMGGLWALLPGVLRAGRQVNEIVLTVMLNEVAALLVNFLVRNPLHEVGNPLPQSPMLPVTARLPLVFSGGRLHWGIAVAAVAVVATHWLLTRTVLGYEVRTVGANPRAAAYGGLPVARSMVLAMAISGALAGVAGAVEVTGIHYRLQDGISGGYGYTALLVSLLGQRSPLGSAIAAFFFAALQTGGDAMQRAVGVPVSLAYVMQAMTVLFVLAGEYVLAERIGRPARGRPGTSPAAAGAGLALAGNGEAKKIELG